MKTIINSVGASCLKSIHFVHLQQGNKYGKAIYDTTHDWADRSFLEQEIIK